MNKFQTLYIYLSLQNLLIAGMIFFNTYTIHHHHIECNCNGTTDVDTVETKDIDSMTLFFDVYKEKSQTYLDRECFDGTPITGELLATAAKETYNSTGIVVPFELALSQAQWESGMGRKGLSHDTNPYNVGEFDRGTMLTFKTTEDGVQAYFNLMAKNYLSEKTVDQLLRNFVDSNGRRYASTKSYEESINETFHYIQRYVEKYDDDDVIVFNVSPKSMPKQNIN
jgi:hypothetical protein